MTLLVEKEQGRMSIFSMPGVKKTYMKPRIIALIPAHNEEKSIRDCLAGLNDQLLPKGVELDVYVIADNCTDRTEEKAIQAGEEFNLNLKVIVTEGNKLRKVGALNSGWKLLYGDLLDIYNTELTELQIVYKHSVKAVLGMDADSRLAPNCLKYLWEGLMSARNIGGVMAKYTMRMPKKKASSAKAMYIMKKKLQVENMADQCQDGGHTSKSKTWQAGCLIFNIMAGVLMFLAARQHCSDLKRYKRLLTTISWMDLGRMIVMLRTCCLHGSFRNPAGRRL